MEWYQSLGIPDFPRGYLRPSTRVIGLARDTLHSLPLPWSVLPGVSIDTIG